MALCYRDRTWCSASNQCATEDCSRKITPEVQEAAERWWGGPGAPFSLNNFSKGCNSYVPTTQDQ
jgi:hypothetical protein